MKRILVASALILGLAACNRDKATTVTPVNPNAYNPDASATESTDTRIPYQGDWVWAAKLTDGSYRLGVMGIATRGTPNATAKNGGVGSNALCADATCTSVGTPNFAVVLTEIVNGEATLTAFLGSQLNMTDSDAKVTLNAQGRAVISGTGTLADNGQTARVAFVQVNADANTEGTLDVVVTSELITQAKAAADAVTLQRVQVRPPLDLKTILK